MPHLEFGTSPVGHLCIIIIMKKDNLTGILSDIQSKFKSKKSRYNSFGKYNFRSAEDILEAIKPFLTQYDVCVRVEEEFIDSSLPIIKSTAIISNGIESISATAVVGVDLNQKGMQVPQQFGSASSYGKKYALGNLLLIDDTQDADATNTHGATIDTKPELKTNTEMFNSAVDYLKAGNSIDVIKKKYKITDDVEKLLMSRL
jgi:hypothetical protein